MISRLCTGTSAILSLAGESIECCCFMLQKTLTAMPIFVLRTIRKPGFYVRDATLVSETIKIRAQNSQTEAPSQTIFARQVAVPTGYQIALYRLDDTRLLMETLLWFHRCCTEHPIAAQRLAQFLSHVRMNSQKGKLRLSISALHEIHVTRLGLGEAHLPPRCQKHMHEAVTTTYKARPSPDGARPYLCISCKETSGVQF